MKDISTNKQERVVRQFLCFARIIVDFSKSNYHRKQKKYGKEILIPNDSFDSYLQRKGIKHSYEMEFGYEELMEWLDELPEHQKKVIQLTAIDDLTEETVGEILGVSQQAVNRTKNRAKTNLMKKREKYFYDTK